MGVQGLWELLAPVGRRVSLEAIANKRVAVDASIWIIQLMKAMRDERGEMIRNAHLLGFFRRICKLLFLKIKPVFVFDGGTPALKRRTVIARRRQRENAQAKIRKTAEKLLLNHLRTRKIEELAGNLENMKEKGPVRKRKGKVNGEQTGPTSTKVDAAGPAEAAQVPIVLQPEPPAVKENSNVQNNMDLGGVGAPQSTAAIANQEQSDALLAASLAAEWEDEELVENVQPFQKSREGTVQWGEGGGEEEEDDDDDNHEVMLMPGEGSSALDPAVLASLPASVQLELMVQMREQMVAENREKFQKVAKAPSQFSSLQIEAYLKTVAMRREITNVQKASAGLGVGGVQSTRIASESNKEFIFSSNFNAPTKALTAPLEQQEPSPLANLSLQTPPNEPLVHSSILLQSENSARTKLSSGERSNEEGERREMEKSPALPSVQTYVDEKGKTRVSRVRGMGVRMTRDLQWNLYLMKDREDSGKAAKFQEGNASDGVRGNTGEALAIAVNVEGGDMDEDEDLFMALVKSTPEEDGEKVEGNMKASEGLGADDDDDDVEWEDGVGDSMNGMLEGVAESGELAANGVKGASIDSSAVEEDVVWEDGSEQEGKKVPVELPKPTDEGERSEQGSPLDSLVRQSQGNSSANAFVEIAGPSSGPSSSTGPQKAQYYPAASLFKVVPNTQYGLEELSGSTSSVLTEVVGGKNGVLEGSIDKTAGRRMEQLKSHLEDESNLRKANRLSLLGGEMYKVAGQLETSNMGELRPSQVETKDDGDLEEAIRLSLEEQGKQTALYGDSDSLPGSPAGGRCLAEIKENSNSPISIPAVESAQPFGPWEGESYGGGDGFRLSEKTSVAEPYCNDGQKLNRVFKDPQIGEDGQTYLEGLSEEELIQLAIQRSLVEAVPAKQLTIREPTLVDVKWGEMCGEAKEKAQAEMGGKEAGDFESRERARKGKRIVEDKIDELDGTDGACIALTENAEGAAIENLIGVGASVEANTIEIGQREGQRRGLPTLSGPGGHAADSNESQKKEGGEAEGTEAGEFHPSSEGRDRAQRLVGDANQSASSSGANGGRSEQRSGWPLRHDAIPPIDEEELLQEAMAIDLAAERAELEERETKLAAEREALRHEEAELQAELEEERNELQFQNEQLMREVEEERVLLREEAAQLSSAQRKNARDAESVTAEMFEECQDLLQIFGIPYIIAPMEAEAQCAFMDQTKMVDAVVTDDCDVFLFGGRNVFKNIFDDRKYVETYLMKDVETELGLTREKLINMALLLGSDYTEGVSGIGIVNAIEVVNAYEGLSGLLKFKQWALSLDETLLNKVEASSRGRGRKGRGRGNRGRAKGEGVARAEGGEGQERDATVDNESEAEQNEKEVQQRVFQSRHRGVSKNWNIPDSFPSEAVVCAYLRPQVDDSSDKFTWGRPDLDSLRLFCRDKLSFSREKADEMLLPVMKAFESHETQLRLEAFYSFNQRFAKIRSKRIQKAVTGITGKRNAELTDLPAQFMAPRKLPATKRGRKSSAEVGAAVESGLEQEGANAARGRKRKGVNLEAGEGKGSRSKERTTDGDVQTSTMAKRGGRRGRGRGGGRGVGGRTGAGEASRGEGESAEEAVVAEVRRSKRQRKSIRYVDPNCEEEAASDGDSCSKDYEPSDDEEGEAVLRDMQAGGSNNLESTNPSFSKRCGEGGATFESSQMPRNRGEPVQCDLSERNLTGSGGYLFSGGGFCLEEEDNPEVEANPVGGGGRHHADSGGEDGDCLDGDSRALDNALSRSSELYKDMVGVKGVAGEETIASSLQRTGLSDLQETEDERQREEGKSLGFMPAERVVAEGVSGEGNESGTGRLRAAPSMKRRKKAAPDAI